MKILKSLTVFIMILSVAIPLNLNVNASGAVKDKYNRDLVFFTNNETKSFVENIKNSSQEGYKDIREGLKTGKVNPLKKSMNKGKSLNVKMYKDVAFPYDAVKGNNELKNELQKALRANTKVFIYSDEGITFDQYVDLLDLEDLSVKTYPKNVSEQALEKMNPKLTITSDKKHEIIGYTLNKNVPDQLVANDITQIKPDGEITNEMLFAEILNSQLGTIEKFAAQESSESLMNLSFIGLKKVSASSTRAFDPVTLTRTTYSSSTKIADFTSDYEYWKQTDENISNADYFALKDKITFETFDGYNPSTMFVKHTPEDDVANNSVESSGPSDVNGSGSTSVSFSVPWGVSIGFSNGGDYTIDKQSSAPSYAQWDIDIGSTSLNNPFHFSSITELKTDGTFVDAHINHSWGMGAYNKIAQTDSDSYGFSYDY